MANKAQARGLLPAENLIRARKYKAASTVYPGDPVALGAAGTVASSITVPLVGVALNYATVGQDVMIADHPDQLFLVEASASVAATDVGQNAPLLLGTASTAYKMSRATLDAGNLAATATLAAKIVAVGDAIDNEAGAASVDLVVKINNHALGSGTGTAGV